MISYAGKSDIRGIPYSKAAYTLFRNGKDSMEIAKELGISEAVAVKRIAQGRATFHGIDAPKFIKPNRRGKG